jgi:AraC-like DNA-binding protein
LRTIAEDGEDSSFDDSLAVAGRRAVMSHHTPLEGQTRIFHPIYMRLLCLYLRNHGVRLADALADTGMTWRQLLDEKRFIPFEVMRSLVLAAKRLTGRPALGLEWGFSVEVAAHGLMGAAIAASRDVSEALHAAVRYRSLRGRAVKFELDECEDGALLLMRDLFDFGDMESFILEAHVGAVVRAMATVASAPLVGIDYRFPYAPPAWAAEYSRWLGDTVRFRAERMEVRVPKRILSLPAVLAEDLGSRAAIIIPAERQLALKQSGGEWVGRIKQRLLERRGTYPGAHAMARDLNMSTRTLLRKLKEEGATYRMLLDDARKEVAEWYLVRTHEPIEAIADRLGYADASNFSRSFRRWFGTPPAKFRKHRRKSRRKARRHSTALSE